MRRWKEKLSKIKMPHTYVILTIILLVVVALCYLIPAGEYVREFDPVSYTHLDVYKRQGCHHCER